MWKGKYSCNLKQYYQVTSLIKSSDIDVKTKACFFSALDINKFVLDPEISSPFGLVRKAIVCLAYYVGLRNVETMRPTGVSTPACVYVTSWCVYSSLCVCDQLVCLLQLVCM